MGDEDGVDQVKEEDDGVMALGRGRTRIYMGDVDGVSQVKKEGEDVKLGGDTRQHRLVTPSGCALGFGGFVPKPSEWFGGFGLKTIIGRFCWFGPQNQPWTVWWFGPQNHQWRV
jgi:hypothetical protein